MSQATIDSLLHQVQQLNGADKLDVLVELCSHHNVLGDEVVKYFNAAKALASSLANELILAQVFVLQAQYCDAKGQQSDSIVLLNQAMDLLIEMQESESVNVLLGETHFTLGLIKKKVNENRAAIAAFENAVAAYRRTQHRDGLAKSLIRLGATNNELGKSQEALADISQALVIAEAMANELRISHAHNSLGNVYFNQGNFTLALKHFFKALPFTEKTNNALANATLYRNIGNVYAFQADCNRAEEYHQLSLTQYRGVKNTFEVIHQLANLAAVQLQQRKYQVAKNHLYEAIELAAKVNAPNILGYTYFYLGNVYFEEHNTQAALENYYKAKAINTATDDKRNLALTLNGIANALIFAGETDQAEPFLLQAIDVTRESNLANEEKDTLKLLSGVRKQQKRFAEALSLFEMYSAQKEVLLNATKIREAEALQTQMAIENKEKEIEIERLRNVELKQAYEQLKAAQKRLIQQEKLASLGQLTAGVAHEIQNPLNFVNNYADISVELLDELNELEDDAERKNVIELLKNNLVSIHKNGSRVSGIVKSMLEHSNAGKSERVLTDINHLVKEHLQFAQSGFKAQNDGFDSFVETNFDSTIPDLIVAPSEIGKVLLNVFNNALYELQKIKLCDVTFIPLIKVSTSSNDTEVEVVIADNGGGIPAENLHQIFEPFFTTKPTGEGVGLGLSIANDIIQSHCGVIVVENNSDRGVSFILKIPVQ